MTTCRNNFVERELNLIVYGFIRRIKRKKGKLCLRIPIAASNYISNCFRM